MPHGQLFRTLSSQCASGFTQSCNQNGERKYKGLTVKRSTHGKYNLNYYLSSICQNQLAFYCFFLHLLCLKMKSKRHRLTFLLSYKNVPVAACKTCATKLKTTITPTPKSDSRKPVVVVQFAKFDAWSRHAPLSTYELLFAILGKVPFPFALEDAPFSQYNSIS